MSSISYYEETFKLYKENLRVASEQGNKVEMAVALYFLGVLHLNQESYQEATNVFGQSLAIYRELGDKVGIRANLRQLAASQRAMSNYKVALDYNQKTSMMAKELGDKHGIALAFSQIAGIYDDTGNLKDALKNYGKGLKLTLEIENKKQAVDTLRHIACVNFQQGKYQNAVERYEESLKLATVLSDPGCLMNIESSMFKCADAQSEKDKLKSALKQHKRSLKNAKKLGNRLAVALILSYMAEIYTYTGKFGDATKQCADGMQIAQELKDSSILVNLLRERGRLNHERGHYEEAVTLYEQSLLLANEKGDKSATARILLYLGETKQYLHRFSEANKLYMESVQMAREVRNHKQIVIGLLHQVQLKVALGDYKEALNLGETGMAIANKIEDNEQAATMQKLLGAAYEGLGDYRRAIETYTRAITLLHKVKSPLKSIAAEDLQRVKGKTIEVKKATVAVPAVKNLPELPGYKMLDRIGSGGYADIFKAENDNGIVVAIKIPKFVASDTNDAGNFFKEAEIWSKLIHPYIVKVYEFGTKPYPWIAMEYMENGSLRDKIGRISIEDSLEIGIKVAKALFHAHHLGVIHRDIKPENILLDIESIPKLTDWGLGKVLLEASMTVSGFRGTLSYSAPEQLASAQFGQVDWRTDIYQLGALLYEMLTGQWYFKGTDPAEAIFRILGEEVPPPSKVCPGLPEELDRIVLQAIARRKEDRPQDVAILEKELDGILEKVRNMDR